MSSEGFHVHGPHDHAVEHAAHGSDPLALDRQLDDKSYSLDHIEAKLARLPGMMQTDAGRRLAEARLATLTAFRSAFAAEWSGIPHVEA